VVLQAIG